MAVLSENGIAKKCKNQNVAGNCLGFATKTSAQSRSASPSSDMNNNFWREFGNETMALIVETREEF
jgi:hypothetical protein